MAFKKPWCPLKPGKVFYLLAKILLLAKVALRYYQGTRITGEAENYIGQASLAIGPEVMPAACIAIYPGKFVVPIAIADMGILMPQQQAQLFVLARFCAALLLDNISCNRWCIYNSKCHKTKGPVKLSLYRSFPILHYFFYPIYFFFAAGFGLGAVSKVFIIGFSITGGGLVPPLLFSISVSLFKNWVAPFFS